MLAPKYIQKLVKGHLEKGQHREEAAGLKTRTVVLGSMREGRWIAPRAPFSMKGGRLPGVQGWLVQELPRQRCWRPRLTKQKRLAKGAPRGCSRGCWPAPLPAHTRPAPPRCAQWCRSTPAGCREDGTRPSSKARFSKLPGAIRIDSKHCRCECATGQGRTLRHLGCTMPEVAVWEKLGGVANYHY